MKCKQHPFERGPGVCAPCLRDRLLAILLEEAHSASASAICSPSPSSAAAAAAASARVLQGHKHHQQQQQEQQQRQYQYGRADSLPFGDPSLAFPRSVSPYVSHRRSAADVGNVGSPFDRPRRRGSARSQLFYSTPQVGPSAAERSKKRWSVLSALLLFRSGRRGGPGLDGDPYSDPPTGASNPPKEKHSSSSSSSWLSWFGRRKSKQTRTSAPGDSGGGNLFVDASGCGGRRRRFRCRHPRGMSPDTSVATDYDNDYCETDRSRQLHSEYSTTTDFSSPSPAWRIPGPTPLRKTPGAAGRHISGFAVCLSPLVWASPGGQRRSIQVAIDAGGSGELKPGRRGGMVCQQRARHRHHGSDGAVLGPNRSRKLVDVVAFR